MSSSKAQKGIEAFAYGLIAMGLQDKINDKFDVVISAEYMIPENFNSAKALWDLIQKLEDEE